MNDTDFSSAQSLGSVAAKILDRVEAGRPASPTRNLAPGIHDNLSAAQYHADDLCGSPTLSSSIAKTMLSRTPRHAWFDHPRLNPAFEPSGNAKFSVGSVTHELLLGRGGGFDILDYENFLTKDAKKERDASFLAGRTPILAHQHGDALAMAEAACERLRLISECKNLFLKSNDEEFTIGRGERVLLWRDAGGPMCRSMVDWMGPSETEVWDLKTTGNGLSDREIASQIVSLGYDLSAGFYLRGLTELLPDLAGRFKFRWIFVSDEEPFECRVVEPDAAMLAIGDRKAALAIEKWRQCIETGLWPGYEPVVTRITHPGWDEARWVEREMSDEDAMAMIVSGRPMELLPSGRLSEIAS